MSMDGHFCRRCGLFFDSCECDHPIHSDDDYPPLATHPYFVIWHDYADGVSHGKIIRVPDGTDPESEAHRFLTGHVGANNFLIEGVQEVKEVEAVREF